MQDLSPATQWATVNRFVGYKVNSYLPASTDCLAGFTVPYQVGRGDSHDDQTVATVSEKSNRNNQWSRVLADVATAHITLIKDYSEDGQRQSRGQSAALSAQCWAQSIRLAREYVTSWGLKTWGVGLGKFEDMWKTLFLTLDILNHILIYLKVTVSTEFLQLTAQGRTASLQNSGSDTVLPSTLQFHLFIYFQILMTFRESKTRFNKVYFSK